MCTVVLCVTIRSASHEFTWVAGSLQDGVWGPQRRDTGQHAKCTNYCCSEKQEAAKKSQVVESCGVQWLCCGFLWNHYIVTIWPPSTAATGEERSGNAPMQKVSFQSAHIIIKSLLVSLPVGYNCAVIDLSTFVEW